MNNFLLNIQKNSYYVFIPVVLFFSLSCAYLTRSLILVFFNPQKIDIKRNPSDINQASQFTPPKPLNTYEDMVEGNMIRGKKVEAMLAGANGAPEVPQTPVDDPNIEEMMLTGTVSGHPSFARASFKEKDKEDAEEYGIARKVSETGYVVKAIAEHHAVITKGGLNLKIEVGETIKDAKANVINSQPEAKENLPTGQKVIRYVSRTDFERYLRDETLIYKDAKFGPNLVNGQIDGYKIYTVASTHIFYQLGARNGDVVKRLNGIPLNNTQKMLEMWGNIKNSQNVSIDIERKGQVIPYEFIIKN
jgi:general secretion pathway protein C